MKLTNITYCKVRPGHLTGTAFLFRWLWTSTGMWRVAWHWFFLEHTQLFAWHDSGSNPCQLNGYGTSIFLWWRIIPPSLKKLRTFKRDQGSFVVVTEATYISMWRKRPWRSKILTTSAMGLSLHLSKCNNYAKDFIDDGVLRLRGYLTYSFEGLASCQGAGKHL